MCRFARATIWKALPKSPPAGGKYPTGGDVEEAVGKDGGGNEEQAEGLVAAEGVLLDFAAGLLLALGFEIDKSVIHALPSLFAYPGSIAEE